MRALVLERPAPLASGEPMRLGDVPEPEPGAGELLLRVGACAVCRTDLQLAEGDLPAHRLPTIPGHQVVGRVEGLGAEVTGWSVGDRAAVGWLAGTCGTCQSCRGGRENLCASARFTAWDRDGGFAEWIVVGADVALRVPDGFDDPAAAPLLCGGVIGYRSLLVSGIQPRRSAGPLRVRRVGPARDPGRPLTGDARCTSPRARRRSASGRSPLGHRPWAATTIPRRLRSTPPSRSPLPAPSSWRRCARSTAAAPWPSTRSTSTGSRPSTTGASGGSGACAASPTTRRDDARAFLDLAATIPIRTETELFALEDGVAALRRLAAGTLDGTAVLVP